MDSPHQVHLMVRDCKYDLNPPGVILYLVQTLLTKLEDHWSHGDHDQSEHSSSEDNSQSQHSAWSMVMEMRAKIQERTQLTASAGIAPNCFLAKVG